MSALNISGDLSLPREAATWVISYLAKRGAGKTYCAAVQAEEMARLGIPIVVVDGMGIFWGLRVSADGLHAGLPIVVFGGEHADLPLVPEKAGEMAKAIVESNISCVLDLSAFTKYVARKIVASFLNELYRLNRVERHIFIEESDLWAPQRPIGPEEAMCLSSVDNFVRRGGNHNLGCTLITQRSAVLNKDILTQSDCLVVLRTLAPQDKKAIQAWVEEQTDDDKQKLNAWYDSLKNLENGEAWVWHPEKPAIFAKVKFRSRETFHATREFIRSPRANKIVLMGVDEFVARFKKIFESIDGTVDPLRVTPIADVLKIEHLQIELEEYRSGRKVAETVQQRLDLLERAKKDLEGRYRKMEEELKLYDELKSVFRQMFPKGIPENPFLTTTKEAYSGVGLQKVTKVVPLQEISLSVPAIRTDTVKGKILSLACGGFFGTWQSVGDVMGKLVEDYRFNASEQAINGALKELVDEHVLGLKHTDRNRWKLAPDVVFEEVKK